MLFSSIPFIYYFLPCVLVMYFLAPKRFRNGVLLASSLFFYGWGEPRYIVLMLISIMVGYISGILLEMCENRKTRKAVLVISVAICIGFLGYYKYADFFIENFNAVTGMSVQLLRLTLPIGISFYTFQIVSYIVDVYRGNVKRQRNIINLAAYITMFPQLIAGPIVRYSDIEKQLEDRKYDIDEAAVGVRRLVLGLGKKILIANTLGKLCEIFKASDDKSVLFFWVYAIAVSLHIYFDFSGYSDMAIGLGKILGFHFPENFNYPFVSKSITEFWRRWHMSLGTWFRDYVYIPLGGNRVSQIKRLRNILIVWLLTGFWHGAAWNFVVWGMLFGVLLILEKKWLSKFLDRSRIASHVYVMVIVIISFVIFNADSMREALTYIGDMFGRGGIPFVSTECIYYIRSYGVIILLACFGSTPVVNRLFKGKRFAEVFEIPFLLLLMIVMTAYLVDGSFNPFLNFRF